MRKEYIITGVLLLLLMGYLYFPKNVVPPDEYFSKEKAAKIYLEFKKGGDLDYHSNIPNDIVIITNEEEIKEFYELFKSLDFDLNAPHRGNRDYSVYINIGNYRESKFLIKMSRINEGYVFFFKDGLYRKDDLVQKINELLRIESNLSLD